MIINCLCSGRYNKCMGESTHKRIRKESKEMERFIHNLKYLNIKADQGTIIILNKNI